jgi:protocatechuate 3,4-dioxygenase beta subunit
MKTKCMLVLVSLLLNTPVSYGISGGAVQGQEETQASPDNPDRKHDGSVAGTVVDESGKPVSSAVVNLADTVTEEPPLSVRTDERGNYKFTKLLPGSYQILAEKDGKRSDSISIKVSNGPNAGPELKLRDGGR